MASKGSPLHSPRTKLIEKAHSLFAETKEHVFESKAAEEHAKLLKLVYILLFCLCLFFKEKKKKKKGRQNTTKSFSEHVCRIQHELEVSTKQAIFVDSSINDTIRTCIVLGNHRAALKVKTEFKVCKFLFALSLRLRNRGK